MNWKIIFLGGLAFYAIMFLVSMPSGMIVHENILDAAYKATPEFWRPELNQDPPDMEALMPRWIGVGLLTAFVLSGIYGWLRGGISGAPWIKGMKYGLMLGLIGCCYMAGWSGVLNLPEKIWTWWGVEQFVYYLPAGAVLGWLSQKLAPEDG